MPTIPYTLEAVAAAGYVVDEWQRWQQGGCHIYAHALQLEHPHLRIGGIDFEYSAEDRIFSPGHFFAHDDEHAYDSAGRHPLPYLGIRDNGLQCVLDIDLVDHEHVDDGDPEVAAAIDHIRRHNIVR